MMWLNYHSIEDITKEAQAEVLLSSISLDESGKFQVIPVKCPGVGRKEDLLKNKDGKPVCAIEKQVCPYFVFSEFNFEDYTKKVICKVI